MEDIFRNQLANRRMAFANRQQGNLPATPAVPPTAPAAMALPDQAAPQARPGVTAAPAWMMARPGQPAPADQFNYEPAGDGSWRVFPPGVQAPPQGPQGSMPTMASLEQLRGMGGAMRRLYGGQGKRPGLTPPPSPGSVTPPKAVPDEEA